MSQTTQTPESGVLVERVALLELFVAFATMSLRSWGGGSGTIFMMHQESVRRGWMTSAQWTRDFALARVIPGIHLLGLAVMTGYRFNGFLGAVVSLVGLVLPASVITLLLTMGFVQLVANPIGNAAVKGTIAVAAALTFSLALDNGLAVLPSHERKATILMVGYAAVCFLLVVTTQISVAILIIAGGVGGAFLLQPRGHPTRAHIDAELAERIAKNGTTGPSPEP